MRDSGNYTTTQLHDRDFTDADIRREVRTGRFIRLRAGWLALNDCDALAAMAVRDGGVLKYAARCLDPDEWIAVCDSYLNRAKLCVEDLIAEMGLIGPTVLDLLYKTDRRSQSGTESIVRVRLRALGFDVVVQPRIPGVGWADLRIGKLILECDSVLHHASKEDYERDHHRDRRALVDGWLCMRLTYDDVLYGWEDTLADIRAVTDADRHRTRCRRDRALVRRSLAASANEDPQSADDSDEEPS